MEDVDPTRTADRQGVKIRDFAYEPQPAAIKNAPVKEYWDPIVPLMRHDNHVRRRGSTLKTAHLNGKDLWRLLECGWVVMEEVERNWDAEMRKAMETYCDQPAGQYPYAVGCSRRKPTKSFRIRLRKASFPPKLDDKRDDQIYMPEDVSEMWSGEELNDESEAEDELPQLERKRKRVDDGNNKAKDVALASTSSSAFASASGSLTSSASTPTLSRAPSRAVVSPVKKRSLGRTQTLVRVQ